MVSYKFKLMMEISQVARHSQCLASVFKDHRTVYLLLRQQHMPSSANAPLQLNEIDIQTQTVISSTTCLSFDNIQAQEANYSLVYACGFLVLVYPTGMITVYQDCAFFRARESYDNSTDESSELSKGMDFCDWGLLAADQSTRLVLKNAVQSQVEIITPLLIDTNLVFTTVKKEAVKGSNTPKKSIFLVCLPLAELELLAGTQASTASANSSSSKPNELFSLAHSKFAHERHIYVKRSPNQLNSAQTQDSDRLSDDPRPTDLTLVAHFRVAVSFSNGSVWLAGLRDSMEGTLVGIAQIQNTSSARGSLFIGPEVKASCVNSIDALLVPNGQRYKSLRPQLYCEGLVGALRVSEYLLLGDSSGNLVFYKDWEPHFYDQVSYAAQIAALKWLNVSLVFAQLTTDGVLKVQRLAPLSRRAGSNNNAYELVKLASISTFDEVNSRINLHQLCLRGSTLLQTRPVSSPLESATQSVTVLWPNRVLMKVSSQQKQLQKKGSSVREEKTFFAECDITQVRLRSQILPMVKRGGLTPIFVSNTAPTTFADYVPKPDQNEKVELLCERNCFMIDREEFRNWVSGYDFAKDEKRRLIDISAESGVHESDLFEVVRLDCRPQGVDDEPDSGDQNGEQDAQPRITKFLCTLELTNSHAQAPTGLCCSFTVDRRSGMLTQNVLQLSGKTGIYLGKLDYADPSILVLQEDLRSLIIFSFDNGDLESKLPHGEVQLNSKVSGVYWSPLRDGLAVLYELQQEGLLTFSKNRLSRYSVKDFGVLVSRSVGLKLAYDERLFDVKWTGFSLGFASSCGAPSGSSSSAAGDSDRSTLRGLVGTNQAIYFVDDKLQALGKLKLQGSDDVPTSLQWMGSHTALVTTEQRHLLHVSCEKHPQASVLLTLPEVVTQSDGHDRPQVQTVIKALSDRVILASTRSTDGSIEVQSRPVVMLEPLLLGYLSATPIGKADVQSVQECLKYLDTAAISAKLLEVLRTHGMAKSVKFLLKYQSVLTQKVGLQAHQIDKTDDFADFIAGLFPQKDPLHSEQDRAFIRKKLALDPGAIYPRKLLTKRANDCLRRTDNSQSHMYQDAFFCADLTRDLDLQLEILLASLRHDERASAIGKLGGDQGSGSSVTEKYERLRLELLRAQVSMADQFGESQFDYKSVVHNHRNVNSLLKQVPERHLQKLMLAFDEVPFTYRCRTAQPSSEEEAAESLAPVAFNSDNFATFIGLTKPLDAGYANDARGGAQEGQEGRDGDSDLGGEASDKNESLLDDEEVDESRHTRAYWRCEEGQGGQVSDITGKGPDLKACEGTLEWSAEPNADGDPLDYSDKWGKTNQANYAFKAPQGGLSVAHKNGAKAKVLKDFTLEMWVKLPGLVQQPTMLSLLCENENQALFLIIDRDQTSLHCSMHDLRSKDSHKHHKFDFSRDTETPCWTHIAIVQKQTSITLLLDHTAVQIFDTLTDPHARLFQAVPQLVLLNHLGGTDHEQIFVSEIRLWGVALSPKQLKAGAKQPLALLFDSKRNLKIQINKAKSSKAQRAPDEGQMGAQKEEVKVEQTTTVKKKKGGLKMTSKLDAAKKATKVEPQLQPLSQEKQDLPNSDIQNQVSLQDSEPISQVADQPHSAFAFDGFDFGAPPSMVESSSAKEASQESSAAVEKPDNNLFSFADNFGFNQSSQPEKQENKVQEEEVKVDSAAAEESNLGFFSFDTFASAANPSQQVESKPQVVDFGGFSEPPDQSSVDVAATGQLKPQIEAFSFGEPVQETVSQLASSVQAEENKTVYKQDVASDLFQLGNVVKEGDVCEAEESKKMEEVKTESVPASVKEPMPELSFSEAMTQAEEAIERAQLPTASALIQNALKQSLVAAKRVHTSGDQKAQVKTQIRHSVLMKFICDLALKISQLKVKSEQAEAQSLTFQQANLTSQIASHANVLILLKLPSQTPSSERLRANFFRFALKQNQRILNYTALSKIVAFWKKANPSQDSLCEKDRAKIAEIEHLCALKGKALRNIQQYHGHDCPDCGANLAFGLATPQCHKCKAKIAICYLTLAPILKDKQMLKCHVCLAQFSIHAVQSVNIPCPICSLVKLKLTSLQP